MKQYSIHAIWKNQKITVNVTCKGFVNAWYQISRAYKGVKFVKVDSVNSPHHFLGEIDCS